MEFEPTLLSLLPAIVAIGLAYATKKVIPALFAGIVTGGIVLWSYTGNGEDANFISRFLIPSLGSESFGRILLIYLWCLGGLIGVWEKTGAALHFARTVGGRFAKGPRSAMVFSWILGAVFHQGGTISTVLTGTTVKPVADAHKVSHEELAYVVDSTASPIATLLPFNAWPAYVMGLVAGTIALFPADDTSIGFFVSSIPYNFYAIFAVASTFAFSMGWLPWVGRKMKAARQRARETGALDAPGSQPMMPMVGPEIDPEDRRLKGYAPHLIDFLLPLGTLLGVATIPYLIDRSDWVNEAFVASVLVAMLVAWARGMKGSEVLDGFVDGVRNMTIGAIILGLAVTLGMVARELGTAGVIVDLVGGAFPIVALPAFLTLLCMGIAFACGTSWGTYAVVFPLAMPLAFELNPDPTYIHICFGAVLGGAVFGDQCSPVSDTTILSSMFTGCDLMDHVKTQLPLAMAAAGLGMVCSTVAVLLM